MIQHGISPAPNGTVWSNVSREDRIVQVFAQRLNTCFTTVRRYGCICNTHSMALVSLVSEGHCAFAEISRISPLLEIVMLQYISPRIIETDAMKRSLVCHCDGVNASFHLSLMQPGDLRPKRHHWRHITPGPLATMHVEPRTQVRVAGRGRELRSQICHPASRFRQVN